MTTTTWSQTTTRLVLAALALGVIQSEPVSSADPDTVPPQIVALSFPSTVDVTESETRATFTLNITDDQSGVSGFSMGFTSPSGTAVNFPFFAPDLISGTPNSGVWEETIIFPPFIEPGTWEIRSIYITDLASNSASYNTETLTSLSLPTGFTVLSAGYDADPPEVVDMSFSPSTIDVSTGHQLVTLRAHITDNLAGLESAFANLESPSGPQTILSRRSMHRVSGTAQDGMYVVDFDIAQYSEAGSWKIRDIDLTDQARNRIVLKTSDLEPVISAGLAVVSEPEDLSPPELAAFDILPRVVDVSFGPVDVEFLLELTDNLAGVDPTVFTAWTQGVYIRSPSGAQSDRGSMELQSGTPLSGVWRVKIAISEFAEPGTWSVSRLHFSDAAHNCVSYISGPLHCDIVGQAALDALGAPTSFIVIRPSLTSDGTISSDGGTIADETFGNRAQIDFPSGAVAEPTNVAIDVFDSPLDVPIPEGWSAPGTRFVNIDLEPEPSLPLPPPGLTVVLPLVDPMPTGSHLDLFKVEPSTGELIQAIGVDGNTVTGSVGGDGLSATFEGIASLSTVVGVIPEIVSVVGDLDGDGDIDLGDVNILVADRNKAVGASTCGVACDLDGDGVITGLDARKLVLLCTRPRCATE